MSTLTINQGSLANSIDKNEYINIYANVYTNSIYPSMTVRDLRNASRAEARRRQVLRYKFIISCCLTVIFILLLSISIFSISTKASDDFTVPKQKYYSSIQISHGDTLWTIAECNMDSNFKSIHSYINEVKEINNLNDDNLISGQYIIIPYYK